MPPVDSTTLPVAFRSCKLDRTASLRTGVACEGAATVPVPCCWPYRNYAREQTYGSHARTCRRTHRDGPHAHHVHTLSSGKCRPTVCMQHNIAWIQRHSDCCEEVLSAVSLRIPIESRLRQILCAIFVVRQVKAKGERSEPRRAFQKLICMFS